MKLEETPEPKRTKIEMIEDYEDYEQEYEDLESDQNTEKLEIVFLPETLVKPTEVKHLKQQPSSSSVLSREEKFIDAVYPQFKGKNKLDLINQILDLERLNEMLQTRSKTYENTINRLLN